MLFVGGFSQYLLLLCYRRIYFALITNILRFCTSISMKCEIHTGFLMPYKCCVLGCKSNYKPPYITCFRIPRDEKRRKVWINRIRRENFQYTENARVCIKHFPDEMIVREDRWQDKDGQIHHILRVNPSLTADALPIIISDTKPHITFLLPKKRKTRDKKEEEYFQAALEESMATYERELKTLQPASFGETPVTALVNGVTATTDEYSIMGSVKKECDGDSVVEYKEEVKTEIEITENNILEDNSEHATTSRDPLQSEEPEVALQPETVWLQECDMMSETDIKVECSGDPIDELKEEGDVEGWPDT